MADEILKHPRAELRASARAIDGMRSAKSLEEFEIEWKAFLTCLEKVWNKVECSCQHVRNHFQPWQGTYHRLRNKDMLLRYLKQARDADNHSIQDSTKIEPGSRNFRFVNPSGGYIKYMEIREHEIAAYEGDPIIMEDIPSRLVVVPVKNNGKWFNPPTAHLEQPVTTHHPVALAELGLKFYEKYVNEVERKFFKVP